MILQKKLPKVLRKLGKAFENKKNINEGKKIIINCEKLETRVALLEDGALEEYNIERESDDNIVGGVFLAKVKNIEAGIKAMFLDIGLEKNAFLHFWDAIPGKLDDSFVEIKRHNTQQKKQKKLIADDAPKLYPAGSDVLVQVSKGVIGNKGPRVSTRISLAGRFLVLMPHNSSGQFGISRKIGEAKERKRLRDILTKLKVPVGMGVIMRTACEGQKARYFVRDLHYLLEQWRKIDELRANTNAPVCLHTESSLVERTVRDFLTEDIEEVVCDNAKRVEEMKEIAIRISKRARSRIKHYPDHEPIFSRYRIQNQIDSAFMREVNLPCGGSIVIDETEALISIDVNTAKNKGGNNPNDLILQTNIEAAREIARQVRLRNIGGIIVIDFIDMKYRRDQNTVYKTMRERLRNDKARTQVYNISPLGLMEMTRQRLQESLSQSLYDKCEHCSGRGRVKTAKTMSIEIQQKVRELMSNKSSPHKDLVITVHPEVIKRLKTRDDQHLVEIERKLQGRLVFRANSDFNHEQVNISDKISGEILYS